MSSDRVPTYFKYGETAPGDAAEAVHAQAIFSRIDEQDWEIRPHRHNNLCQLFLVTEGEIEAVLELERITLSGPCLLLVPMGKVHGFSYNQSARGKMISVAESFLRSVLEGSGNAAIRHSLGAIQVAPLAQGENGLEFCEWIFMAVEREVARMRPGYSNALGALLQLLFVHLGRHLDMAQAISVGDNNVGYVERFRNLVRLRLKSHATVAEYCAELGIGERRLNRICRAVMGESPSSFIHGQLVEEAKRFLAHTAMPVTSVGYELGFGDSAYFSRFFKRQTGVTPSEFAAQYRS